MPIEYNQKTLFVSTKHQLEAFNLESEILRVRRLNEEEQNRPAMMTSTEVVTADGKTEQMQITYWEKKKLNEHRQELLKTQRWLKT